MRKNWKFIVGLFLFLCQVARAQERPCPAPDAEGFTICRITRDGVRIEQRFRNALWVIVRAGVPMVAKNQIAAGIAASVITGMRPVLQNASAEASAKGLDRQYVIDIPGGQAQVAAVSQLLVADPTIEWVGYLPQGRIQAEPTDPGYPLQWNLRKIHWQEAIGQFGSGGYLPANRYYYVLDTGVEHGNPELSGRIPASFNALKPGDPIPDRNGHATFIATLMVANANNGVGIAGLDPTGQVVPVKVCYDNGNCDLDALVRGLAWAADHFRALKARNPRAIGVVNMSLGGYGNYEPVNRALDLAHEAGLVLVAGAGNDRLNIDITPISPGSHAKVKAIGGVDEYGFMGFNYGPKTVKTVAPGFLVPGVVPWDSAMAPQNNAGAAGGVTVVFSSGTSFATPHAAVAIALMLDKHGPLTSEQIDARLASGADLVYPVWVRGRRYDLGDLTSAAGSLDLRQAAKVDIAPPAPPFILMTDIGYASMRLRVMGSGDDGPVGKAFGYRFFVDPEATQASAGLQKQKALVVEAVPFRGGINGSEEVLIPGLEEGKSYVIRGGAMDSVGNWSAVGPPASFTTGRSRAWLTHDTRFPDPFQVDLGPWYQAEGGSVPLVPAWHWTDRFRLLGPAWYAGSLETLDIRVGAGYVDQSLLFPIYDLRAVRGSVTLILEKFFWMRFGGRVFPFGVAWDAVELGVSLLDDWQVPVRVISDRIPQNRDLATERVAFDLSAFAGRLIRPQLRLYLSGGAMIGPGFILTGAEVRVGEGQPDPPFHAPPPRSR